MLQPIRPLLTIVVVLFACCVPAAAEKTAGVASVDITPDYPIRLSGFAVRTKESESVGQHLFAKALALGEGKAGDVSAVLITVDNLGVPDHITHEVAKRLAAKAKLDPARLTITSTHTHSAPMLAGVLKTLFGKDLSGDEQKRIERYTAELTDNLERAALAAIADIKPATLEYGIGSANFSINRRTPGGPVDHDLPMLVVRDPATKKPRAIYVSYACHCVVLSDYSISGDWAGYVQEIVQKNYPGAIALTSVGCGGDSNPAGRGSADIAMKQGKQIADEVDRLLKTPLTMITEPLATKLSTIELMFDTPPTREEFAERAKKDDYIGYHARVQLARLDRGEKLQTKIDYPIQTWAFGNQLAAVFLGGEVVVDYSLRLKREFDRNRLWVNAYSNDVPCYIPSERILKEGGYEGGGAMTYYDRPTRLAPGLEQKIIDEVHRQMPPAFVAPKGTEGKAPRAATDALKTIHTKPGLEVELVASEPLIESPVAIDWSADGRLWVCEMYDYPTGADQNWQPGGRVKVLEDTDHDGRYDKATLFLDNIPFPTGVTAWGDGVLVCAAPDILFARDTDHDGKADKVEKIFSGFFTDNYQARVNSLTLGLDNWIYGANGLLGGTITGVGIEKGIDTRNHDFRFRPLAGPFETVSGLTQQGRVRDDWGRWFGCDNSNALRYFPHEDRYLARSPHVPAPPAVVMPPGEYNLGRLYPASRLMERFNNPNSANAVTSACGLGIYRDTLLGDEYAGNAFVCEPVHNLVHRMILMGEEPNLSRKRADDEKSSEFLASTDNWFRPVQVRTGPDGAMYVVDMYRFLIEHPRWIPAERLAQIDARAGSNMGRIYRIRAAGKALRDVPDLTKLDGAKMAALLDTPNGTERDRIHIKLLAQPDDTDLPRLRELVRKSTLPQVRLQALAILDSVQFWNADDLLAALHDTDAQVRKAAVRVCEPMMQDESANPGTLGKIEPVLLELAKDPSPIVRHQLAYSLGEWDSPEAGKVLAKLATDGLDDAEMRTAVLSSAGGKHCGDVLTAVMATKSDAAGRAAWVSPLVATAAASDDPELLRHAIDAVLPEDNAAKPGPQAFSAIASLLDAMERKKVELPAQSDARLKRAVAAAREIAANESAPVSDRESALLVLKRDEDVELLCQLAAGSGEESLRRAAVGALRRQSSPAVADRLLTNWQHTSPAARAGVIDLLLSRDSWTTALLQSVQRKVVRTHELSLADRQRLNRSDDAEIKKLAAELFPAGAKGQRAEIVAKYLGEMKSSNGDASKGRDVFAQNCAACHLLDGVGHAVGPDLSAQRGKDAGYFVQNILDPSAIVEPRFANYQIVLKDRRTLSGVITAESPASLTLATGNGASETIARADVKDIRVSPISMMPEGFESAIPPALMSNLVAFLRSDGGRKSMPGNQPAAIAAAKNGSLILPAAKAEIFGSDVVFETEFGNIGNWHGAADHVAWNVQGVKAGDYDAYLDYACANDSGGNTLVLEAGEGRSIQAKVAPTGPDWSQYKQTKIGTIALAAGEQRIVVRAATQPNIALLDLRTIALVPAGAKPPRWPTATAAAARRADGDDVARDPTSVARVILDPSRTTAAREAAINANPQFSAELIAELTSDITPATEYDRIPWIWRIAIAAGRRDDAAELKRVLAASLPKLGAPLQNWQAVVVGGGVINGISQRGLVPAERVTEILAADASLDARWQRALELASVMADDAHVRAGTRYDALRMLGATKWETSGKKLAGYLDDANAELRKGALAGLVDMASPDAARTVLPKIADGKIPADTVGGEQRKRLLQHADPSVRELAVKAFKP